MTGEHVRWRHTNPDGTRTRDVDGTVVACQLGTDNKFRVLVACPPNRLETAEAGDVELAVDNPTPIPVAPAGKARKSLLAKPEPK